MLVRSKFLFLASLGAIGVVACGDDTTGGTTVTPDASTSDGSGIGPVSDAGPDGGVKPPVDGGDAGDAGDATTTGDAEGGGDAADAGDSGDASAEADAAPHIDSVDYTFATGTQGWTFNTTPGVGSVNLAVPDAGVPPTLVDVPDAGVNASSDGGLSALSFSVTFSYLNQYINPIVAPSPTLNLTGRTISALVRVVAGSFPATGGASLGVRDGTHYVSGASVAGTSLQPGALISLSIDLSTLNSSQLDATKIAQIGIDFTSGSMPAGSTPDGGADAATDSAVDAADAANGDAGELDAAVVDAAEAGDAAQPAFGPVTLEIIDVASN